MLRRALIVFALTAAHAGPAAAEKISAEDVQKIAAEAYVYGLPQVIFYGQRWIVTQDDRADNAAYAGINRFSHTRKKMGPDVPDPALSATTLEGAAVLDLRKEPMVLEIPEIVGRYFNAQCMDQYGHHYFQVGNQFNGTKARAYLLLPVGYAGKVPRDFATTDVIPSPSNTGYCRVRLAVMTGTDEEMARISGLQDQITLTPLNKWLVNNHKGVPQKKAKAIRGAYEPYARLTEIARQQVKKQTAADFFTILNLVLNDPSMTVREDSIAEAKMIKRLARIGIGSGQDFEWSQLDPARQQALNAGFQAGVAAVQRALTDNVVNMNGWKAVRNSGKVKTPWLARAMMTHAAWGEPDRNVPRTSAVLTIDADNVPLDGKNAYTLTVKLDNLPPVTEFWSISIQNQDGSFVRNDLDRYAINSFMLTQKQLHIENGRLVIYLQRQKPADPNQLKNWLPAPNGPFRLRATFYGPKWALVDGSYKMPRPVK